MQAVPCLCKQLISYAYFSNDENFEAELTWKSVDPVATPKSRKSIVTSTKIGDQIFTDHTNYDPYSSLTSDQVVKVGVDRQNADISENILTLSEVITRTPVSGLVHDDGSKTHQIMTKRQSATKYTGNLAEDVHQTRSVTTPPAGKLRRISNYFANRLVNYSPTVIENNESAAESLNGGDVTVTIENNAAETSKRYA